VNLQVDEAPEPPEMSLVGDDGHRTGRRADIQGLRAVAVGLVVAFHAGLPVSGGFIGVDMFFVISGFVITAMLLRQLQDTARLKFGSFYTRRVRRLLPALALVIVFVAAASLFLLSPFGPQRATARTGIAASLFSANLQLGRAGGGYFDLASETNALLHTWSLSVEEQFYLVFPALLVVAWRLGARFAAGRSRRRTTAIVVGLATVASFAFSWYTTYHHGADLGVSAFYSPLARAWEFGVGALLALAAPALFRVTRRVGVPLGVIGVAVIAVGAVVITGTTPFPGVAALVPVVGTALLLVAGMSADRGVTALLGLRPAVWIGDVSYGWYLWHWPLIVFAAAMWPGNKTVLVVAAIGSLAPTALSYRYLENPIRFNDRLTGRRVVPLVVVGIAVPILACLGLLLANRLERRTDTVKRFAATEQSHADTSRGCTSLTPIGKRAATACTWPVDQPQGTIVLVGDSNAGQFIEPVAAAANQLGYDFTAATVPACPFADLTHVGGWIRARDGVACHRFVTESVAALVEQKPALVIVASSSSQWVNNDGTLIDPRSGEKASTPEARAGVWQDGLTTVLRDLDQAGIPTVVVHPVPHFGDVKEDWLPATCPVVRIFAKSCGTSIDRGEVERQQQPARDAENRAVADVPGSTAVDFTDVLCSAVACVTDRDGRWLYRDAAHLSVDGALTLTDQFRQLITDHAAATARP
jgi:peptidoglycan/LPS O-acetylase OafA/YrhL